ncbi:MAG: hypothetical protein RBR35_04415, partial [Salinivirgaceae bacterium]|nr:hypothetical protein [Salinivirgaceae bacterium]
IRPELQLWYILNNTDPQRDIFVLEQDGLFVIVVDGRRKKHNRNWPNVIAMDKKTIQKVDQKWPILFQVPFIKSPTLEVESLVLGDRAELEN